MARCPAATEVFGRDVELATVHAFVAGRGARALVLAGEAGIGKTTLWQAGIDAARARDMRVLVARPDAAETELSFSTLRDLFDGVTSGELWRLPAPQREALEVALLRAAPRGAAPQPHAIALGLLGALRALSAARPVLVAIDDMAAVDEASAHAIGYAARRLGGARVNFLLTRREGQPRGVEERFERAAVETLDVGPVSIGAVRRILADRLAMTLSRRVLRQVCAAAHGNPLFVLELGRVLHDRGLPTIGEQIALPQVVGDLLAGRIEELSTPARDLVTMVAAGSGLRRAELAAVADDAALDDALDAGVVTLENDLVELVNPMLGTLALQPLRAAQRRALHRELAGVVEDVERRGRHIALATTGADAEIAGVVAAAAAAAMQRGAIESAVRLGEHALRLTSDDDGRRVERLLALGEYLGKAGEAQRVTDLLTPELDSLPAGEALVRAYLLRCDGVVESVAEHRRLLARALAEAGDEPALRALVLARKVEATAGARLERLDACEAWAAEALAAVPGGGDEVEQVAAYAATWCRILRGQPIGDAAGGRAGAQMRRSPARLAALRRGWRGDVRSARIEIGRLIDSAEERADDWGADIARWTLCGVELRAGEWAAAEQLLDDSALMFDGTWLTDSARDRCRALIAAGRGDAAEAERHAAAAIAGARKWGMRWDELEAQRALGIAALLAREPERALEPLRAVWTHTTREGIDEPGAFPVVADLVEALVELGELDEARTVTRTLCDLVAEGEHPWGHATARRCTALIRLGASWDPESAEALADAAADYEQLRLPFDHARTLLSLGSHARRARKWGAARAALGQAVTVFDSVGSPGWTELARAELARIGGRRAADRGELTTTERRIAELAASGLSNKELAQTLFVTVSTVESHLTRVYAKLGIRSRVLLQARLA